MRELGRIRLALARGLSDEAMHRVVNKLVALVVDDGCLEAARFLFAFVVGPPLQRCVNPDDLDGDELVKLRLEGQPDAMGNDNLIPAAAVAVERARRLAASVETLAEELADPGSDTARHLLAVLQADGLARLADAARDYAAHLQTEGDP
jgi:hypothetical protein